MEIGSSGEESVFPFTSLSDFEVEIGKQSDESSIFLSSDVM